MTNKDLITPVTIIGIGIIALLLLRRKNSIINNQTSLPESEAPGTQFINDPTEAAYSPSLAPQLLGGGNINVNIADQGFGYLSNKYIPLFGFVGMAQGETFH